MLGDFAGFTMPSPWSSWPAISMYEPGRSPSSVNRPSAPVVTAMLEAKDGMCRPMAKAPASGFPSASTTTPEMEAPRFRMKRRCFTVPSPHEHVRLRGQRISLGDRDDVVRLGRQLHEESLALVVRHPTLLDDVRHPAQLGPEEEVESVHRRASDDLRVRQRSAELVGDLHVDPVGGLAASVEVDRADVERRVVGHARGHDRAAAPLVVRRSQLVGARGEAADLPGAVGAGADAALSGRSGQHGAHAGSEEGRALAGHRSRQGGGAELQIQDADALALDPDRIALEGPLDGLARERDLARLLERLVEGGLFGALDLLAEEPQRVEGEEEHHGKDGRDQDDEKRARHDVPPDRSPPRDGVSDRSG